MQKPYHQALQAQLEAGETFIPIIGRNNFQLRKEFTEWLETTIALAQEAELLEAHNEQSCKTEDETPRQEAGTTKPDLGSTEPSKAAGQDAQDSGATNTTSSTVSTEALSKLLNRSKKDGKQ